MTAVDLTSRRMSALLGALWSGAAWRATRNGLAALLVAVVGTILIGGIGVVCGAAIFALATGAGDWGHVTLYAAVVVVGPVLALWAIQGVTALQRSRLHAVAGVDIPAGSRAADRKPWPVGPWLAAGTWRQIGFHVLSVGTGCAAGLAAACWLSPAIAIGYLIAAQPPPAGWAAASAGAVVLLFAAPWLAQLVARADEALARALLGPSHSEALALKLESMTRSRAETVAATDAERRRIERDLHDGVQAGLVALGIQLGRVESRLEAGQYAQAAELVRTSRQGAKELIGELRELVRGIHPPALDSGLEPALTTLAARSPIPTTVRVRLPERPPASVETMLYFSAAELLTNAGKHSEASSVALTVLSDGERARLIATDDGKGGARLDGEGSGLRGLAERVRTIDGHLDIDSPPGGPTTITIEVPTAL